MAKAKTGSFDPALVRTAGLAKALSHPVRIRILEVLAARKGCLCGGLVDLLPLAQSTLSQHLRELRDAGLIRGRVDGPRICYCINAQGLAESWASFKDMFSRICGPLAEGPASPGAACGTARNAASSPRKPSSKRPGKSGTRRPHDPR